MVFVSLAGKEQDTVKGGDEQMKNKNEIKGPKRELP